MWLLKFSCYIPKSAVLQLCINYLHNDFLNRNMEPLKYFKNYSWHERLIAYIIVNYRWIFVLIFLLPLSVVYNIMSVIRDRIIFYLNSAPKLHEKRVKNIQKQIRTWWMSGSKTKLCTARPGWKTMSFRVGKYKSNSHKIYINLIDVLFVDVEKQFVRVEPLVTMGQLSATLLPLGWTIPVLPELDDLTVGGLIMGSGIETSSHKHGLFQHTCIQLRFVLHDGELITCSPSENEDMFYAAFWSHGTIGFLVSADIKIIPAKSYIKVDYYPCHSMNNLVEKFQSETMKQINNEFVEALVFSPDSGVVMVGNMCDKPADIKQINSIGKFYKPWFFKHVESILEHKTNVYTEFIPIRDYYHRHSRSIFWELQDIIPFGNNTIFRHLLGWAVPPKISLLKLTQGEVIKKMYEANHVLQDMFVPIRCVQDSILFFEKEVSIFPLWLCSFRLSKLPGFLQPNFDKSENIYKISFQKNDGNEKYVMYVDIGVYGVPKVSTYDALSTTRNLEAFVRKVGGFQMLYADTYMTRKEFREMFNHSLYDKVREKYHSDAAFPEIYDKISKDARN